VSRPHRLAVAAALLGSALGVAPADAQGRKTLAERLGFDADAKLLIVHADDIGLARSVNVATVRAYENGGITSGSVIVPSPWFPDFAAYYREHPTLDVGIHITLTAEWDHFKWGGVLPSPEIPSLLDDQGYLPPTVEAVAGRAVPAEVEREVRAQIERARAFGIRPTHLDTHMGTMLFVPALVQVYLDLGKAYGLPLLIPRNWLPMLPADRRDAIAAEHVLLDGLYMMDAGVPADTWRQAYAEMIAAMGPGLNQLIVHLAIDDAEMQAIAVNHPDYGSAWRQRDLDFVSSEEFRALLREHDVKLVSWGRIRDALGGT
jgi:predicted glycoside hydrolase/deacetylase ChbG (UPF0249 family)